MNNLISLVKVDILNGINKVTSRHKFKYSIMAFYIIIPIIFSIYYARTIATQIVSNMDAYYTYILYFVMLSIYFLVASFVTAGGSIFGKNKLDMIMSLPVNKKSIIVSKFVPKYIYFVSLSCLLYLGVVLFLSVQYGFNIIHFINVVGIILIGPIIPMVIGTTLSGIYLYITSKMRVTGLLRLLLMGILICIAFQVFTALILLAIFFTSVDNAIWIIYPIVGFIRDAFNHNNPFIIIIPLIISILIMYVFCSVLSLKYVSINETITTVKGKKVKKTKNYKPNGVIVALIKKEINMVLGNFAYASNYLICDVILTIIWIVLLFVKPDVSDLDVIVTNSIWSYMTLLIVTQVITVTTTPSISMEGKRFWLLKSLPVKVTDIFVSKVLASIIFKIPPFVVINLVTVLFFGKSIQMLMLLIIIIIEILAITFFSMWGLLMNLKWYNINYISEASVLKRDMPVFIYTLTSVLIILGVLNIWPIIGITEPFVVCICVMFIFLILNFVAIKTLNKYGLRQFKDIKI